MAFQPHRAIALLALAAAAMVLVASSRYGAGLTADSVRYVSAARSLAQDLSYDNYDGSPYTGHPPFYPTVLAAPLALFGVDPTVSAAWINALLLAAVVAMGGALSYRMLPQSPALAGYAAAAIALALPLVRISLTVWTELLFIALMLGSVFSLLAYLERRQLGSLALLALFAGLACLTRYIGPALVLSIAIVLFAAGGGQRRNLAHLAFFVVAALLPLGLWMLRNELVSGTLTGPRGGPAYDAWQYMSFMLHTGLLWFAPVPVVLPGQWVAAGALGAGVAGLIALPRPRWRVERLAQPAGMAVVFCVVYSAALVVAGSTSALHAADNRLLAPMFIPLILLLMAGAQRAQAWLSQRVGQRMASRAVQLALAGWLLYPAAAAVVLAHTSLNGNFKTYNSRPWLASQTLAYTQANLLASGDPVYTNHAQVIYILQGAVVETAPRWSGPDQAATLAEVRGSWPPAPGYLVLFDQPYAPGALDADELAQAARLTPLADLADGEVYWVEAIH